MSAFFIATTVSSIRQIKDRNRFHMCRMWKHIDHARQLQTVTALRHQFASITRQSRWITRDINDTLGLEVGMFSAHPDDSLAYFQRPFAWWIDQHAVEAAESNKILGTGVEQITAIKRCLFCHTIDLGIVCRTLGQGDTALDTDDFTRQRRNRQREITKATK